jgi:hypothetical protein
MPQLNLRECLSQAIFVPLRGLTPEMFYLLCFKDEGPGWNRLRR